MPFYDYKCTVCGDVFEIMKGMGESADPKCPARLPNGQDCGSPSRRVFYAPGIGHSSSDLSSSSDSGHGGSCSSCASGACGSCGGH